MKKNQWTIHWRTNFISEEIEHESFCEETIRHFTWNPFWSLCIQWNNMISCRQLRNSCNCQEHCASIFHDWWYWLKWTCSSHERVSEQNTFTFSPCFIPNLCSIFSCSSNLKLTHKMHCIGRSETSSENRMFLYVIVCCREAKAAALLWNLAFCEIALLATFLPAEVLRSHMERSNSALNSLGMNFSNCDTWKISGTKVRYCHRMPCILHNDTTNSINATNAKFKLLTILIGMNCRINWEVFCPDLIVSSTKEEMNPVRWLTCESDNSELKILNRLPANQNTEGAFQWSLGWSHWNWNFL